MVKLLSVCLAAAVWVCISCPVQADDKKDEIIGAVWRVETKDLKNEWEGFTNFHCKNNRKVMSGNGLKEVGTWKLTKDGAIVTLTDVFDESRRGVYTLVRTKKDGTQFKGEFKDEKGEKQDVRVILVKD